MPSETTRERKIEFIKSFGLYALEDAISRAVLRVGAENFLTDDQLDEIIEDKVKNVRIAQHFQMRNRKRARVS